MIIYIRENWKGTWGIVSCFKNIHLNYYMKFFHELYDSNFNYVKGYSFVMRYLNELILKGEIKSVSCYLQSQLIMIISIFFFFMHADALAELVLKKVENIVWMSFSTQYAICIFYIQSIFAWLNCGLLFFATKNAFFFFSFFLYYLTAYKI